MTTDRWLIHRRLAEDTDQRLALIATAPQHILLFGADGDCSRRLLAERYLQATFSEYDSRADHLQAGAKLAFGNALPAKAKPCRNTIKHPQPRCPRRRQIGYGATLVWFPRLPSPCP